MMLPIVRAQWTSLILLFFAFGGLLLFLYGFFPLKYHGGSEATWDDLPTEIDDIRVKGKELYVGNRARVVLMVIDALRYDFVNEKYMPYTQNMIKNGEACIFKAHAEPPTVTMPRIKSSAMKRDKAQWRRTINFWRDLFAMTTGSISNFIDIALNFGSTAVTDDSFLNQLKKNNKMAVFYGDDTWLRLFPNVFTRSEGTTSFYVTDYTEVDSNVTRNLPKELSPTQTDWDLMILHYLGLDHIGHLEGPQSPKVLPKMIEMDNIIQKIMDASKKWDDEAIIVICGDHGMKDSGSHGGASYNEVTVPLIITQKKGCSLKMDQEVDQIDVAPTLSYLLGIPIPNTSTGQILAQVLSDGKSSELSNDRSLYALYYNAKINTDALLKILGEEEARSTECYKRYLSAIKHHGDWIRNAKSNPSSAKTAASFYRDAMNNMAHYLTKSSVEFDMYAIMLGIILITQTLVAQVFVTYSIFTTENAEKPDNNYGFKKTSKLSRAILIVLVVISSNFIFKIICGVLQTNSSLCKTNPISIFTITAIIGIIATNAVIAHNIRNNLPYIYEFDTFNMIECFLIIGSIIYPLTYGSTSFIEEEHQFWYFFWASLSFLILLYTARVLLEYYDKRKENATELQDKESISAKMEATSKRLLPQWLLLMCIHRFLRTLNQTGDKWAFLPDTGDWLNKDENYEILSLFSLSALLSTTVICLNNLQWTVVPYKTNSLLIIGSTLCIYLYRVTIQSIQIPILGHIALNELYIIRIFWLLILAMFIVELVSSRRHFLHEFRAAIQLLHSGKSKNPKESHAENENSGYMLSTQTGVSMKLKLLTSRMITFLNMTMLICSLYLRPHNLILVPALYITSKLVNTILDFKFEYKPYAVKKGISNKNVFCKTLVHFWIGSVFYFYQGNSNSLASIDIGSGYIGLESYRPFIVALQMGIHTYTGPLLALLLLFTDLMQTHKDWETFLKCLQKSVSTLSSLRVYTILVYSIVCMLLRYHLFVWTVFSPKLLYEFTFTLFTICVIIIILIFCSSIVMQEKLVLSFIYMNTKRMKRKMDA